MNLTHPMPENVTRFTDLLSYSNQVTNQAFAPALLVAIFVISFMNLKQYPTPQAFSASSFITAVASYLLFFMGLLAEQFIIITTIMVVVSIFFTGRGRARR